MGISWDEGPIPEQNLIEARVRLGRQVLEYMMQTLQDAMHRQKECETDLRNKITASQRAALATNMIWAPSVDLATVQFFKMVEQ